MPKKKKKNIMGYVKDSAAQCDLLFLFDHSGVYLVSMATAKQHFSLSTTAPDEQQLQDQED